MQAELTCGCRHHFGEFRAAQGRHRIIAFSRTFEDIAAGIDTAADIAGLAGYAIYEYMAVLTFHSGERHTSAVLALAFLFGCLGQRLLARIAGGRKRKKVRA
jgi:hypothetical protein